MSDVITLSSDEEDVQQPPKKKVKLLSVNEGSGISKSNKNNVSDIVILSDDETEGNINKISIIKTNQSQECSKFSKRLEDTNCSVPICNGTSKDSVVKSHRAEDQDNKDRDNDNIVIDENNSSDSSGKENKLKNNFSAISDSSEPSTSADLVHDTLLENFLKVCEDNIAHSQYEYVRNRQFPVCRRYYKKCSVKLRESSDFLALIEENMERAQKSPATAIISFNEIFQYIKDVVNAESIEVSEEHRLKLKKLEKTIRLLLVRIKHLENSEVNFDDEEDSIYIQLDRYTNRLNKVYQKYCELLKKNPYSGRITYEKLDFVHSEYNEINRAISKKYKNNEKFPSYYEMEQFIRKIITQHNLDLSESKIRSESILCFKKLGELLQIRRKKELFDAHYLYIRDSEDPASTDKSLDSTLKQHFQEGQVKIEKICDEFRVKEELGEEPALSEEDSDKSDEEDSEKEEENDN